MSAPVQAGLPLPQPMKLHYERPHGLCVLSYYTGMQMHDHARAAVDMERVQAKHWKSLYDALLQVHQSSEARHSRGAAIAQHVSATPGDVLYRKVRKPYAYVYRDEEGNSSYWHVAGNQGKSPRAGWERIEYLDDYEAARTPAAPARTPAPECGDTSCGRCYHDEERACTLADLHAANNSKTTPAPWKVWDGTDVINESEGQVCRCETADDAALIVSLRNSAPQLQATDGFVLMPKNPSEAILQLDGWPRMEWARYQDMLTAALARTPAAPVVDAEDAAISAAMAEGNRHGVKSTVSARIVAAYLAVPQAAPVVDLHAAIPTWEERVLEDGEQIDNKNYNYMMAEIADLRAALARHAAAELVASHAPDTASILSHYEARKDGYAEGYRDAMNVASHAPSVPPVAAYLVRSPRTGKERFMSKSKKHLIDHWQNCGYEVTAMVAAPKESDNG